MSTQTKATIYSKFLLGIKQRIHQAQYDALKIVNKELIEMYWDIGCIITTKQNKINAWGKSIVHRLAEDLQKEFPGIHGFSSQNLWRMRQFYQTYADNTKLSPMVREISWTHNIIILMNCKENLQREFYIRMTRKFGWTKNVLIHQIENQTYEKTLNNQTNFTKTLARPVSKQAKLAVKDEYTFDFLELGQEHSEKEFEFAIVTKVERFLKEMGGMFAFLGRQYRLEISNEEYFIDLLLYHRLLKCLIAVEIKIGKFLPEHIGKMQFYLTALDDLVRLKGENPSIGIILCKSKDKTIVEYALRESRKPIGVAQYRIVSQLPKQLHDQLPAPEQIEQLLTDI